MKASKELAVPAWSECSPEPCVFPRVEIGDEYEDPAGLLKTGMEVLLPCENCGASPNEYMEWLDSELVDMEAGYKKLLGHKDIPLFHWSPTKNRLQIRKYGLVPNRKPTVHSIEMEGWRAPYICFGTDPAWAWALSGNMSWAPLGDWDLWETHFLDLTEPEILSSPGDEPWDSDDGIHEVRTGHRVFKRSLRYVGTRTKESHVSSRWW